MDRKLKSLYNHIKDGKINSQDAAKHFLALENQLKDLNTDQEIVAYCRGPHCVLAYDAVEQLRKRGIKARRLEDGYPEWKLAGLPIEQ